MSSSDGRYMIVFNCEIYSFFELSVVFWIGGHVLVIKSGTEAMRTDLETWVGLDVFHGFWYSFLLYTT